MASLEQSVQAQYGRTDLLQSIEVLLKEAGVDPAKPHYTDLHPFDQLHGRGVQATEHHAARAGIREGMHVLDLGSGIGGSSRYLAAACGCRVTGIDLTDEFVRIATVLTERCGLADRATFRQASALALPFEANNFDHVWCHNVTMNIADRATLAREVARVLKPGARFSCIEIALGPAGAPRFPLPWATDESASALHTPAQMRAALEAAGLRLVEQDTGLATALAKAGPPPPVASQIVVGDHYLVRVENSMAGIREGRLSMSSSSPRNPDGWRHRPLCRAR